MPKLTTKDLNNFLSSSFESQADAMVALTTLIHLAYADGFKCCLRTYGIWKDGEQTIGAMQRNIKDISEQVDESIFCCDARGIGLRWFPF